jgi:biotin transport system ATP-binding protein
LLPDIVFSVKNLSKIFPNGNAALSSIDMNIFKGDCLIIAGSNGSGKTLLMRLIAGLADPSAGEIFFRGLLMPKAVPQARRSVGLVFQDADAQIVGETVVEDIAFGPKNLGLKKAAVLERVDFALACMGLEEKKDYPPRRLSGGEKRRLAVAGILAMGCEVVIMDEPFANLDFDGVVQVLKIIAQLKKESKTLIILTHELEKVLAFADRLVILHKGAIKDDGDPTEVLDRLDPCYGVRDPRKSYAKVDDCTWLTA